MVEPDLYALLGVARSASAKDIKRAFYRRVDTEHPDKVQSKLSAEAYARYVKEWALVSNAYSTLSDAQKRSLYDRKQGHRHVATRAHAPAPPRPRPPAQRPPPGVDEQADLEVPFLVALRGGRAQLGALTINVPQGVVAGGVIKVPGLGGRGSPPGNLFVTLTVRPHTHYRLAEDGLTLLMDLPMTWHEVYRRGGGPLIVPTPWGDFFWRYQSGELVDGQEVKFEGYGVRRNPADRRNHLLATIRLIAPPPDDLALQHVLQRLQESADVRSGLRTSLEESP